MASRYVPYIAALVVVGLLGTRALADDHLVAVTLPELSELAQQGQHAFGANCAICHGENGSGSDKGPPLIHKIYEPSHHADMAFVMAMRNGVRAHHWPFGDMAPIESLSLTEMEAIIAFVREVQVANGID
jgi:mono/diheme cytochrome c family protein